MMNSLEKGARKSLKACHCECTAGASNRNLNFFQSAAQSYVLLISQLSVFDMPGDLGGGAGDRTRDLGCNPVCHPGHMDCQLLIPSNCLEIY